MTGRPGGALPDQKFWAGKRVFITGHTGFKGGWLTLWLHRLGADIAGYALAPPAGPRFFQAASVATALHDARGDIRDAARLTAAIMEFAPDIVFHLAAQPLVRAGYAAPVETFEINVIGTLNVLDAIRRCPGIAAAVVVTSDKVYAETPDGAAHHETARLGGRDPYSASKAAAEIAVAGFPMPETCRLATVRSGNVIGGGDWAADRLVADFLRAMAAGELLRLRQPGAIRPWQHVLDPLCGYLLAAERLVFGAGPLAAWNFGPGPASEVTVQELAEKLCALWGENAGFVVAPEPHSPHEAPVLRLDAGKAMRELGWAPRWGLDEALARTVSWFRAYQAGADMRAFSLAQIGDFE